jgi:hypothetical protein
MQRIVSLYIFYHLRQIQHSAFRFPCSQRTQELGYSSMLHAQHKNINICMGYHKGNTPQQTKQHVVVAYTSSVLLSGLAGVRRYGIGPRSSCSPSNAG